MSQNLSSAAVVIGALRINVVNNNITFLEEHLVFFINTLNIDPFNFCILGNFACFFCRLQIFFKINFFENFFQLRLKSIY